METPPLDDLAFLGLTADTDLETLKRTRNALMKSFHPDRFHTPEEKAEAHEQSIRINAAYERIREWLEGRESSRSGKASSATEPSPSDGEAEKDRRDRAEARRREEAAWKATANKPNAEARSGSSPPPAAEPKPAVATARTPRQWDGLFRFASAMLLVLLGVGIGMLLRTPPVHEEQPKVPVRKSTTPKQSTPRPTVTMPNVRKVALRPGNQLWEAHIGAVSVPPVVGTNQLVYVANNGGTVHAFHERSGLAQWKTEVGTNVLFLVSTGDGSIALATADRKVHVLEGTTGAKRWEFQDTHATYALVAGLSGLIYVESLMGRLSALELARGTRRWEYNVRERTAPPTLGANGILYVSRTSDFPLGNGAKMMKQDLVALDAATGRRLWEFPMGSLSCPATVGPEGTVFAHSHKGPLYALNGTNGTPLWQNPIFQMPPMSSPSLTPAGGLFVTDFNGWKTYAINRSTGVREWEFWWGKLANRRITGPDGTIHLTSGQHLCVVNPVGAKVWERDLGSPILSVQADGVATTYATTTNGTLFAMDTANGHIYWDYSKENGFGFTTPPVLIPLTPLRTVLVTTTDGKIIAVVGGSLRTQIFRPVAK